jgi:hypothetical protein
MSLRKLLLPLCFGLVLAVLSHCASAQLLYHVAVDTSDLTASSAYYAEFTLSDGTVVSSGVPSTNNSVLLSAFTLGGGALGAVLPPIGDASGNMNSSITLADGDPGGIADFAQGFEPGSALNFNVDMTTVVNSGGVPDVFTMYLLDSNLNQLTTNAPADTPNAFIRVNLTSSTLTIGDVQAYGNTTVPVPPPVITNIGGGGGGAPGTPEPSSITLLMGCIVFGSLAAFRRRQLRTVR